MFLTLYKTGRHLLLLFFVVFTIFNSSAQVPAYVPTSALLAYYGFNGNGNDQSGNGSHGTVTGATYIADRYGNSNAALNFAGSDRVNTQTINRTVINSFSYSIWVYPTAPLTIPIQGTSGGVSPAGCVIAPVNGWNWSLFGDVAAGLNVGTNGIFVGEHGHGITNVALAWSGSLSATWHHIAVVYFAKQPKLYVDGAYVHTGVTSIHTVHPSIACDSYSTGTTYRYINAGFGYGAVFGTGNFVGKIDDIAIYGRDLNPCEIQRLYDTITISPTITVAASILCAGVPTTFTGTGSGLWSSSSTSIATVGSSSGIVTGAGSGSATISYGGGGCVSTAVVSINALPAISGSSNICLGGTPVTLSNTTSGGIWASSDGTVATVGTSSGVVTGVSLGTAVISYIITYGTDSCIATKVVTVNSNPAAISGPSSVCSGATITMANPSSGGIWGSSNISIATVGSTTGIVTGIYPGVTDISYTLPGGCFVIRTITVNLSPVAIAGVPGICIGIPALFINTTGGGVWSSSSPTVASVGSSTGIVTGMSTGGLLFLIRCQVVVHKALQLL